VTNTARTGPTSNTCTDGPYLAQSANPHGGDESCDADPVVYFVDCLQGRKANLKMCRALQRMLPTRKRLTGTKTDHAFEGVFHGDADRSVLRNQLCVRFTRNAPVRIEGQTR